MVIMFLKIVLGNFLWYRGLDDAAIYGALPMCLALYMNHLIMVVPTSCPFYSWGNWGWEKHRRLSKATSLAGGGDGTGTWTVLFQSWCPEQPQMYISAYFFSNKPTTSSQASWKTRTPEILIPKRTMADDYTQLLPTSERPSLSMKLPSRTIWGHTIHGV